MRLTLTSVDDTQLRPLSLSEGVLPVGRNDEPFGSYPQTLVGRLSRRHARVFRQEGEFYVSDLGSKNGTQVNGAAVREDPVRLQQGDELAFAGDLHFLVGLDTLSDDTPTRTGFTELVLEPTNSGSDLTRLVIREFPLLIGKSSEPFVQFGAAHPDELLFLSRRHAHLYSRDGQVFVEDLGSTNGTYLSGERLADQPRALHDGETLSFGGSFFDYRVRLGGLEQTRVGLATSAQDDHARTRVLSADSLPGDPDTAAAGPGESTLRSEANRDGDASAETGRSEIPASQAQVEDSRTTFVSSPTSFLEIFCSDEDEPKAGPGAGSGKADANAADAKQASSRVLGGWRLWTPLALIAGALVIAALIWTLPESKEQQLKQLVKEGQLQRAAQLSNQWMADPDARGSLQSQATAAFLKHLVPGWQDLIGGGSFDEAERRLSAARPLTSNNPEAARVLELLQWITRLEALVAGLGGSTEGQLRIYRDEPEIRAITADWTADEAEHTRLLDLISVHVPDFEPVNHRVYSQLRGLRTLESVYLRAIAELTDTLKTGLKEASSMPGPGRNQRLDGLAAAIASFGDRYPKVSGLADIARDLAAYRISSQLIEDRRLSELAAHMKDSPARTPLFQRHRDWLAREVLPSPAYMDKYLEAESAWKAGKLTAAIDALTQIQANDWRSSAADRLAHFGKVSTAYEQLRASQSDADYPARLVAFYRLLDEGDAFFRTRLAEDFDAAKAEFLKAADRSFDDAASHWEAYRGQGGIDGRMRLSRGLTKNFRDQASRLTEGLQLAENGLSGYRNLNAAPAEWQLDIRKEMRAELARQRQWLKDLELVMDRKIIRQKLALLSEETGHAKH